MGVCFKSWCPHWVFCVLHSRIIHGLSRRQKLAFIYGRSSADLGASDIGFVNVVRKTNYEVPYGGVVTTKGAPAQYLHSPSLPNFHCFGSSFVTVGSRGSMNLQRHISIVYLQR